MADEKPKKEAAAASAESEAAPKKKKKLGMPLIVGGVMLVEGVAIFGVMKMTATHPAPAHAATMIEPASKPAEEDAEVALAQLRALNGKSGRPILYSLKVFVRVKAHHAKEFKAAIEKKKATIDDALARIIRSAEPAHLSEDGLETLRRQIQFELARITNPEMVLEILIPECTPYPTGF